MNQQLGKTEAMINELVRAVVDGQPRSAVIARTRQHSNDLMNRVGDRLTELGLKCRKYRFERLIEAEGSSIRFFCVDDVSRGELHFRRGTGVFVDHAALDPDPRPWVADIVDHFIAAEIQVQGRHFEGIQYKSMHHVDPRAFYQASLGVPYEPEDPKGSRLWEPHEDERRNDASR